MKTQEIIAKRRYYKSLKRKKDIETIETIITLVIAFLGMVIRID